MVMLRSSAEEQLKKKEKLLMKKIEMILLSLSKKLSWEIKS